MILPFTASRSSPVPCPDGPPTLEYTVPVSDALWHQQAPTAASSNSSSNANRRSVKTLDKIENIRAIVFAGRAGIGVLVLIQQILYAGDPFIVAVGRCVGQFVTA